MGRKSARSEAIELHRKMGWAVERIAEAVEADPDEVREWIYGKARAATARRGISEASPAQRQKVSQRPCIISGEYGADPAHVWPRSLGGCDDSLCVVPLCREEHRAYDRGELDILPALLAHGYVPELQHALGHANGDLIALLERVTADRWEPVRR